MSNQNCELPKLPLWRGLLYCSGNMSSQLLQWTFGMYLMYFYCPPEGSGFVRLLPIATVSIILSAGRIIDGFLEPFVGYWSDRTRTRWGRRIPFIMFGGLPMCGFFLLMWYPPFQPNTWQMAAWLMATQTLFWLSVTTVFCPYLALLAEIVRTNKERVSLSMIMQVFLVVGTGIVMTLPQFFEPIRENREMFIIIAVMGLVTIYAVVFGVPERTYCGVHEDEHYGIFEALKWTFTNKAFVIYLVGTLFMWLGFQILMNGLMYVNTVLLGKPEGYMMVWFAVIFVSVAISFVIILKLLDKVTKKTWQPLDGRDHPHVVFPWQRHPVRHQDPVPGLCVFRACRFSGCGAHEPGAAPARGYRGLRRQARGQAARSHLFRRPGHSAEVRHFICLHHPGRFV